MRFCAVAMADSAAAAAVAAAAHKQFESFPSLN